MSIVYSAAPGTGLTPDDVWIAELTGDGAGAHAARQRLHDLLLRSTRHQVSRLRSQLPGAGYVDLEDLAQQSADDALVAVLGKLETFEGRSRFTTWAFKFGLLHAGVAVRRQAWRHREVELLDTHESPDLTCHPELSAQTADLRRAVESAIVTDLTPHQRRVTVALLVDEVPIDVLAERLNTSRNALYKTLHDARQRLRARLRASGHLEDTTSGRAS